MKATYLHRDFPPAHLAIIDQANQVLAQRRRDGFATMTLREVYYQFIARDLFPDDRRFWWDRVANKWVRDKEGTNQQSTKNAQPNYKWLGALLVDARMAGLIDWSSLADNVRSPDVGGDGYADVPEYASGIGSDYSRSTWEAQPFWIEVWVEKDAQVGIVRRVVSRWRLTSFACRGNVSSSAIYQAATRLTEKIEAGKQVVVLHLGDHDPNGIDMSRDNEDRLARMMLVNLGHDPNDVDEAITGEYVDTLWDSAADWMPDGNTGQLFTFRRIGLNLDQIRAFNPPPSPAKITDSRARSYIERFGQDSWELDALTPQALAAIITENVSEFFDQDAFDAITDEEEQERQSLMQIADRWDEVADVLGGAS